ncbi:hypothetical protein C8R44DRAFT_770813 [Mycena epipterygia]|nr:hypothetical protein C8R44DRAFT_770813 [Mycena epipterygia]
MATRNPPAKKSKPPACNACKARRVLCHPQPNGIPCPRCAEKGVICKTDGVPRGRPRKNPIQDVPSFVAEEPQSVTVYESILTVRPSIALSASPELSSELVQHLFECFMQFPQSRSPLFHHGALKDELASVSWQIHRLPPQIRVLVCCICALSASLSFHSAIIGPGPQPESLVDHSVFFPGSDLRIYGVRRAPMYRALYEHAFTLACEARIHLEASQENAASCSILDLLERLNETTSRPWAVAYVNHVRTLAGSWGTEADQQRPTWAGALMAEALAATSRRMPVLITHTDQLLITGSEPPSLEQLFQTLQVMHQIPQKPAHDLIFVALQPFLFHVTGLARELHDKISGDYARRHPLSEVSVIKFLSSLSTLQSILALAFDQLESSADTPVLFLQLPCSRGNGFHNRMHACAFVMSVGFTGLVLALHQEIEYRATQDTHDTHTTQNPWVQDRTGFLRLQVHEITSLAVGYVTRTLQLMPLLPLVGHFDWSSLRGWAQFCLAEADAAGAIPPARVKVFETIISSLKLIGYSWDLPQSSGLIERMEAYVALSHIFPSLDDTWTGTGMFGMSQSDQFATYYNDNNQVIPV